MIERRILPAIVIVAATLRFGLAGVHGVAGNGDFRVSFPGPYAESLNPTLWNSPELQDSWGHLRTYQRGPTEYLTLYPLALLNSYSAISRVLLPVYAALVLLTWWMSVKLFDTVTGRHVSRGALYGTTLLFFPLLQAFMQREFETVIVLALVFACWMAVTDRLGWFGTIVAYITWFKYTPIVMVPYTVLRRWWRALLGFAIASCVLLAGAHVLLGGLGLFFNNFVPGIARGQAFALASERAFCSGGGAAFGPTRTLLDYMPNLRTDAGIRWSLCSLSDRGIWPAARATYIALAAVVLVFLAAGFIRLERVRGMIPPAEERWRRVWELSAIVIVYTTFLYTHYYYLAVLILPLNALLVRFASGTPPRARLLLWAAAYVSISAFVLPVSIFDRLLHLDFWSFYMEHLFCFGGELLLLSLVLYEYVTLPIDQQVAGTPI